MPRSPAIWTTWRKRPRFLAAFSDPTPTFGNSGRLTKYGKAFGNGEC